VPAAGGYLHAEPLANIADAVIERCGGNDDVIQLATDHRFLLC
jgi:hypothetical protein